MIFTQHQKWAGSSEALQFELVYVKKKKPPSRGILFLAEAGPGGFSDAGERAGMSETPSPCLERTTTNRWAGSSHFAQGVLKIIHFVLRPGYCLRTRGGGGAAGMQ